ncbi:MAG: hypothetical protein CUN49_16995, partial [Candidatus Thermofonsia Clade 1 bacterium]
ILAEILGLTHWEAYEQRAKERAGECGLLRDDRERELKSLEVELAQAPELRSNLDQIVARLEQARADLDRAEEAYRSLIGVAEQLAAAKRERAMHAEQVGAFRRDLEIIQRDLEIIQREIEQHTALIAQRAEIERREKRR